MLRGTPLIVLLLVSCSGSKDEENIRLVHARFQDAIIRQDGSVIVEILDSKSRAHYDTLLTRVKNLGRAELEALPVAERLETLLARVRVPGTELANMTGEDLLKRSISAGWTSKASVGGLKLSRITVDGDTAKAKVSHQPQVLRFTKENGAWRLSQVYMLKVLNSRLETQMRKRGMAENDTIMKMLKKANDGKDVADAIWDGPL